MKPIGPLKSGQWSLLAARTYSSRCLHCPLRFQTQSFQQWLFFATTCEKADNEDKMKIRRMGKADNEDKNANPCSEKRTMKTKSSHGGLDSSHKIPLNGVKIEGWPMKTAKRGQNRRFPKKSDNEDSVKISKINTLLWEAGIDVFIVRKIVDSRPYLHRPAGYYYRGFTPFTNGGLHPLFTGVYTPMNPLKKRSYTPLNP